MKVEWTTKFELDFDIDQAQEDFHTIMFHNPENDPESAIYGAVEANLDYDKGIGEFIPYGIIEHCATALKDRIGGVQLKMEGV